jgi:serine/threonine-protein kinase RsbW
VPTAVTDPLILHVQNRIEALSPATAAAEKWLAQHEASPEAGFLVILAIDELVTNCIKYGYDDKNAHTIEISLSIVDHAVTMVVVDDGHPFDPLKAPKPDLSLRIEDRPIGGLGLHLLRELSDTIAYERRDGTNRLTLTKKLN